MNNKYKDFYFLHIRKTGGRYVKLFILKNLKNSVNVIDTGEKHSGWIDKITPETYVFTVFRDPVKQICSLYAHAVSQKANLLEISKNSDDHLDNLNKNIKDIHLDKKYLFAWLERNKWVYNIQSKEILRGSTESKNVIDQIIQKYTFNNNIDKDLLYTRLKRINLLVRQTSLYDPEPIVKKICSDLGIDFIGGVEKDQLTFYNMASSNLYKTLTEEEKAEIEKLFDVDCEVYNNDDLFYKVVD